MNLYKVMFEHYSQKDSKTGIEDFVLKENDSEIFDYVRKNYYLHNDPNDMDSDDLGLDENDPEFEEKLNEVHKEFKRYMIEVGGSIGDEHVVLSDLYYGATVYGWELVKEDISEAYMSALLNIGIIKE